MRTIFLRPTILSSETGVALTNAGSRPVLLALANLIQRHALCRREPLREVGGETCIAASIHASALGGRLVRRAPPRACGRELRVRFRSRRSNGRRDAACGRSHGCVVEESWRAARMARTHRNRVADRGSCGHARGGFVVSPWHGLRQHEPLGHINRLRKPIYRSLAIWRHELNGVVPADTAGIPADPRTSAR